MTKHNMLTQHAVVKTNVVYKKKTHSFDKNYRRVSGAEQEHSLLALESPG